MRSGMAFHPHAGHLKANRAAELAVGHGATKTFRSGEEWLLPTGAILGTSQIAKAMMSPTQPPLNPSRLLTNP